MEVDMAYENYIQVTGVIQEISSGGSCCTLQIALRTDQDMVNFIVNGDTQIIDNIRLRRGMRIAAESCYGNKCGFQQWAEILVHAGKCRIAGVLYHNYIQYSSSDDAPEDCCYVRYRVTEDLSYHERGVAATDSKVDKRKFL